MAADPRHRRRLRRPRAIHGGRPRGDVERPGEFADISLPEALVRAVRAAAVPVQTADGVLHMLSTQVQPYSTAVLSVRMALCEHGCLRRPRRRRPRPELRPTALYSLDVRFRHGVIPVDDLTPPAARRLAPVGRAAYAPRRRAARIQRDRRRAAHPAALCPHAPLSEGARRAERRTAGSRPLSARAPRLPRRLDRHHLRVRRARRRPTAPLARPAQAGGGRVVAVAAAGAALLAPLRQLLADSVRVPSRSSTTTRCSAATSRMPTATASSTSSAASSRSRRTRSPASGPTSPPRRERHGAPPSSRAKEVRRTPSRASRSSPSLSSRTRTPTAEVAAAEASLRLSHLGRVTQAEIDAVYASALLALSNTSASPTPSSAPPTSCSTPHLRNATDLSLANPTQFASNMPPFVPPPPLPPPSPPPSRLRSRRLLPRRRRRRRRRLRPRRPSHHLACRHRRRPARRRCRRRSRRSRRSCSSRSSPSDRSGAFRLARLCRLYSRHRKRTLRAVPHRRAGQPRRRRHRRHAAARHHQCGARSAAADKSPYARGVPDRYLPEHEKRAVMLSLLGLVPTPSPTMARSSSRPT